MIKTGPCVHCGRTTYLKCSSCDKLVCSQDDCMKKHDEVEKINARPRL